MPVKAESAEKNIRMSEPFRSPWGLTKASMMGRLFDSVLNKGVSENHLPERGSNPIEIVPAGFLEVFSWLATRKLDDVRLVSLGLQIQVDVIIWVIQGPTHKNVLRGRTPASWSGVIFEYGFDTEIRIADGKPPHLVAHDAQETLVTEGELLSYERLEFLDL